MLHILEIVCVSAVCQLPPANIKPIHISQARCETELARVIRSWKPAQGAYTFNCRVR